SGACVPAHCFNGVKDGDETGVDCGGSCSGCDVGNSCKTSSDCSANNCVDGICCGPSCYQTCRSCALATTGQPDGTCVQVEAGKQTTNGCNAAGQACSGAACVPAHCFNGVKDGDETGVDCGGSCSGCDVGNSCKTSSDCSANNCVDGICCGPSCYQTCYSCALAITGRPNGTCAQVPPGQQTTNGCTAAGAACDDLTSCVGAPSGTATPTATVTPNASPTTIGPSQTPATPAGTPTPTPCVGDCNGSNSVTVDEILTMVNIALGNVGVTACTAGDANHDGRITVEEILTAVNNALNGCH
ncbi:MAG: hypothetical protein ACHQ9S_25060, partial [Candidatus Binatia bacterium]